VQFVQNDFAQLSFFGSQHVVLEVRVVGAAVEMVEGVRKKVSLCVMSWASLKEI